MKLEQAARQALEALENAYENGFLTGITGLKTIDIITAVREALDHSGEANEMVAEQVKQEDKDLVAQMNIDVGLKQKVYEALAEQAEQEPVAWTATRLWNRKDTWKCPADIEKDLLYAAPVRQAEQEPVAWVWLDDWLNDGYPEDCFSRVNHQNKTPLYSAPVRTKDLTDGDIQKLRHKIDWTAEWSYVNFARAVIAADREKNNV